MLALQAFSAGISLMWEWFESIWSLALPSQALPSGPWLFLGRTLGTYICACTCKCTVHMNLVLYKHSFMCTCNGNNSIISLPICFCYWSFISLILPARFSKYSCIHSLLHSWPCSITVSLCWPGPPPLSPSSQSETSTSCSTGWKISMSSTSSCQKSWSQAWRTGLQRPVSVGSLSNWWVSVDSVWEILGGKEGEGRERERGRERLVL